MSICTSAISPDLVPAAPDGAAATLAPAAHDPGPDSNRARPPPPEAASAHVPFLNFVRYLKGDRTAIGEASYLLARHRAESALLATDRVYALLCRIEAIADHRIDNDVAAVAKLPNIRDLARAAIAAHIGAPFENPLFPLAAASR
jgi:hypothetical protein